MEQRAQTEGSYPSCWCPVLPLQVGCHCISRNIVARPYLWYYSAVAKPSQASVVCFCCGRRRRRQDLGSHVRSKFCVSSHFRLGTLHLRRLQAGGACEAQLRNEMDPCPIVDSASSQLPPLFSPPARASLGITYCAPVRPPLLHSDKLVQTAETTNLNLRSAATLMLPTSHPRARSRPP